MNMTAAEREDRLQQIEGIINSLDHDELIQLAEFLQTLEAEREG